MKKILQNITCDIIDIFLGIPESVIYAFDRGEFYRMLQAGTKEKTLTCSNICKVISNLKRQEYIEIEKIESGNESIKFTNKAKLAIIDRLSARTQNSEEYCLVSFDIPERLKANRNRFRRAIKKMGFRQLQRSLWAHNKRLGNLVELASIEYEVSDYVVYFISNGTNINIGIDNFLKKDNA